MTDPQLRSARSRVAFLVSEAFLDVPLEAEDAHQIAGALSVVESLRGAGGTWAELLVAVAASHYWAMSERTSERCGCGLSRLCRRDDTGFQHLADALSSGGLMWSLDPPTAEDAFAALRAHDDAEQWPVPEFQIGVGTGYRWNDILDRDDYANRVVENHILHVLAFHGRAMRVRDIAADVHPDLTGKQAAGRLRSLKAKGLVAIHPIEDPETGESFNRWSYVPRDD